MPDLGAAARVRGEPITICAIGDLILDVVVLPERELLRDGDTPATIRLAPGGQAANVAAWAASLGASSRLICKRGSDLGSELAAAELERRGVELCGPVVPGMGGVVLSLRDAGGGRTMASDRGVSALLQAHELDPAWLEGCDALHVSGYCLFEESMAQAATAAAALVPKVSVDLASAGHIRALGVGLFSSRVRALNPAVVFANEAERAAVPELGGGWVIKQGAKGTRFPEGFLAAPPVTAVDTTGAGDALAAGYLIGGAELAIEAASRCVGVVGGMPPAPLIRPAVSADPAGR